MVGSYNQLNSSNYDSHRYYLKIILGRKVVKNQLTNSRRFPGPEVFN